MAQPPLSRSIQALERELGFALFDRSRRQVELTEAGSLFLRRTRALFDVLEAAVKEARHASQGLRGRLRVGYLSSLAYSGLAELLRAFRERFPGVDLVLREQPPSAQVEAMRSGEMDVGFVRVLEDSPTLLSEKVRSEPLVACLPENHPLARQKLIALGSLAKEPFVCFPRSRGPAFFDHLMSLCRQAGFTPNIVQEAPQLDIATLVAAGFGVALLPESIRSVHREGLVFRPLEGAPSADLVMVWRRDEVSPVVRGFVELVREQGLGRRLGAPARRKGARSP